jgi:hypothetical protein
LFTDVILPQTSINNVVVVVVAVIGKAIPIQALTSPEGSRRLRLPDFKTTST